MRGSERATIPTHQPTRGESEQEPQFGADASPEHVSTLFEECGDYHPKESFLTRNFSIASRPRLWQNGLA